MNKKLTLVAVVFVALVAVAIAVAVSTASTTPAEAGPAIRLPISCANVLCLPCPAGTVPAPPPINPKNLGDCCKCIPVKR